MRPTSIALVSLLLFATAAPAQKPTKQEKAWQRALEKETALRERVAREWLNLASVAVAKGSKTAATDAVKRAREIGTEDRLRLESLTRRADGMDADASPEDAAVGKKRTAVIRNVCRTLDQMAVLDVPSDAEERIEGWLWMAHDLDPKSRSRPKLLQKIARRAAEANKQDRIRRLLEKAATVDPAGYAKDKYLPALQAQARHSRVKIRGKGHPMEAFVTLPRSWTPGRKWPVVVYLDGPKQDYLGTALDLRDALGDREYVLVIPFIKSNHKMLEPEWIPDPGQRVPDKQLLVTYDVPGIKAITAEVQRLFSTEKTFAISGFSVGAMLNYWWIFRRPQDLWAASPISGHYAEICSHNAVRPKGKGPKVRVMVGADDVRGKYRRWPQNEKAVALLKKIGHGNVEYVKVKDKMHDRLIPELFKFLDAARR